VYIRASSAANSVAAHSGADFHDGIAGIVLVRRHDGKPHRLLRLRIGGAQRGQFLLRHLGHFRLGHVLRHGLGLGQVALQLFPGLAVGDHFAQPRMFPGQLLRPLLVVVKIGRRHQFLQLREAAGEPVKMGG